MRVMCIDDNWKKRAPKCLNAPAPKCGDTDMVVGVRKDEDGDFFRLASYKGFLYSAQNFIPLQSDTAPEIEIEQLQPTHA